jgi:DNA methylase
VFDYLALDDGVGLGRNGIVLDLFGGSGSTLVAAHKTGRRARLCELDPIYCDRILQRWERFAKDDAELVTRQESAQAPASSSVAPDPATQKSSPILGFGSGDTARADSISLPVDADAN